MFNISKLFSLIMSLITMVTSLVGIASRQEWPQQIQDFENKKTQETVRVMSFNIRCLNVGKDTWEDRIGIVTETINKSNADSVGVQEATTEWMETLDKELTSYAWVGVGRDDGKTQGEFSSIFYLKNKYNLIDSGTFWLSETPDTPSLGWDAGCNRVCTWAVLENKETKEQYVQRVGQKGIEMYKLHLFDWSTAVTSFSVWATDTAKAAF